MVCRVRVRDLDGQAVCACMTDGIGQCFANRGIQQQQTAPLFRLFAAKFDFASDQFGDAQ